MSRSPKSRLPFLALALALTPLGIAQAQPVMGSGISPGTEASSPARDVGFAFSAPADAALVVVMQGAALPADAGLSAAESAAVAAAMTADGFEGKADSKLSLRGIGSRPRVLLVGVGSEATALDFATAAGTAAQDLKGEKAPVAIVGLPSADLAAEAALGYHLGQYRFDRYKSRGDVAGRGERVSRVRRDVGAAEAACTARQAGGAAGVRFGRDLINEPPGVTYPESFVGRTREAVRGLANVEIEVLDEAAM